MPPLPGLLLHRMERESTILRAFADFVFKLTGPNMASIEPFAALRPKPDLASKICELPYDVMSSQEAREIARDNPLSFLHVSKPEIDLAPDVDLYSSPVYARGRDNFRKLIADG